MTAASPITGFAHYGLRVAELERSRAFYEAWGFQFVAGPIGPEPVAILRHPAGIELNLVLNAEASSQQNILMDVETKYPGYTHVALAVRSIEEAVEVAKEHDMTISGGPVQYPHGPRGLFLRDPDRNVVELFEPATNRKNA